MFNRIVFSIAGIYNPISFDNERDRLVIIMLCRRVTLNNRVDPQKIRFLFISEYSAVNIRADNVHLCSSDVIRDEINLNGRSQSWFRRSKNIATVPGVIESRSDQQQQLANSNEHRISS